jgi:hypothetical protein
VVIMPGCKCCPTCGWPDGRSIPDSVEVVLEDEAARTFSLSGPYGNADVYVPSMNGTFSLSLFTPGDLDNWFGSYFIYKGTSNGSPFQVGLTWNSGAPNFSSFFDNSLAIGIRIMWTNQFAPPPTTFMSGAGGVVFGRRCTRSTGETINHRWGSVGLTFPNLGFPSDNRDVYYESGAGCYLPGRAETDVMFRTDEGSSPLRDPTSHTFPISRTVTDPDTGNTLTAIGFRLAVRVFSVNLIYGTTSVPFLDNLGQTTCPTF